IGKYNDTSKNPDLSDVYGIDVKGQGDLGSQVEAKIVGGPNTKAGTTVGGVFGTGTSVDTKDIDKNIDKAAKSDVNSQLPTALAALKASDQEISAASNTVKTANEDAKASADAALAAHYLVEEQKAGEEKSMRRRN